MTNTLGILLDTGPIIALLAEKDPHHKQIRYALDSFQTPFKTCESVISEACFIMRRISPQGPEAVFQLGNQGLFKVSFNLKEEWDRVEALLKKYRDTPISLADASLIRMAELYNEPRILTLDSDFNVYRYHTNKKFENLLSS